MQKPIRGQAEVEGPLARPLHARGLQETEEASRVRRTRHALKELHFQRLVRREHEGKRLLRRKARVSLEGALVPEFRGHRLQWDTQNLRHIGAGASADGR